MTKKGPIVELRIDQRNRKIGNIIILTDPCCVIDSFYVDRPYRRRGIGSRLLERAQELFDHLELLAEPDDPSDFQKLVGFYKRHGFEKDGKLVKFKTGQALPMIWEK